MIAADGDVDDDELAILRRIDGPRATPSWDSAQKAWKKHDFDECIALVAKVLDRSHVNSVMANLIDIAMVDGHLAGDEQKLLEAYMDVLSPDQSRVEMYAEVIGEKNFVSTL
jgi:tellurite resistance protein